MKRDLYNLILAAIATAALLGACKRTELTTGEPSLDDLPQLAISPSINSAISESAGSRVTIAHGDSISKFEPSDAVGIFMYDEKSASFTVENSKFTASADTVFSATSPIYYASYAYHNLYAYYPHADTVADMTAVPVAIALDQTVVGKYAASDFLSDTVMKIKPQQINPKVPAIPLQFKHRMTNVVVKIANGDKSPLLEIPVITITNVANRASFNIASQTLSGLTNNVDKEGRNTDVIVMRRNPRGDNANTELCYDAIVMPQAVASGVMLMSVQIGTGSTARTYGYAPKPGDEILGSGLTAGAEHIFTFTIQGTKLRVQGGEVNPWGTGTRLSSAIGGGGISLSRMIFEIGEGADLIAPLIKKASLKIDGITRQADVAYIAAEGGKAARLLCVYNQSTQWGYWLEKYVFYDADGGVLWGEKELPTPIRLLGNYNLETYNTVIATLNPATGEVEVSE